MGQSTAWDSPPGRDLLQARVRANRLTHLSFHLVSAYVADSWLLDDVAPV